MTEELKTVRVRITGRVQGVGFRAWTVKQARCLDLAGFVRNDLDGAVIAVVSGPEPAVATLIDRLWEGPASATVSGVETQDEECGDRLTGFRVER
ncbi:MAG: acylphosphatase [Pseudorhizobium sp.]